MQRTSFRTLLALTAMTIGLAACGGGGGGDSATSSTGPATTPEHPSGKSITGKAIDGYLVNAKVCLDLNANNVCDAGDPTTTTDASGGYSLAVDGDTGDVTGKKIIVIVDSNTKDLQRPNYQFPASFTLSASVEGDSGQNVTPITTMHQSLMEQGYSKDDAAKLVVGVIGGQVNLRADYIANGDSTSSAFAMAVVDKVAAFAKNGTADAATVRGVMNAIVAKNGIDNVTQADVEALAALPVYTTDVDAKSAIAEGVYGYHEYIYMQGQGSTQVRNHFIQNGDGVRIALEAFLAGQWQEPNAKVFTNTLGTYQLKADGTWTGLQADGDQYKASPVTSALGNTMLSINAITGGVDKIEFRRVSVGGRTFQDAMNGWMPDDDRTMLQGSFAAGAEGLVSIITRSYDTVKLDLFSCGADQSQYIVQDGVSHCNWLGDKNTTYSGVDQLLNTEFIMNGLVKVTLNSNGTVVMKDRYSGTVLLSADKVKWTRQDKNPNVLVLHISKDDIKLVPLPYTNDVLKGGNIVVALHDGRIQVGTLSPASVATSFLSFKSAVYDQLFAAVLAIPM